jgi:hypothetical protein
MRPFPEHRSKKKHYKKSNSLSSTSGWVKNFQFSSRTALRPIHSTVQWVLGYRMASSGMLRFVALVRTDVSVELSASIIRVTRIGELGTTLAVTSNRRTL